LAEEEQLHLNGYLTANKTAQETPWCKELND